MFKYLSRSLHLFIGLSLFFALFYFILFLRAFVIMYIQMYTYTFPQELFPSSASESHIYTESVVWILIGLINKIPETDTGVNVERLEK